MRAALARVFLRRVATARGFESSCLMLRDLVQATVRLWMYMIRIPSLPDWDKEARSASASPTWRESGTPTISSGCSKRWLVTLDSLVPRPLQALRRWYEARHPSTEDNDPSGAARNIARHYDLSNDLFATFLDESMSYSAALFTEENNTLEQAQAHKIERLLDVTGVRRGTRLLEIGTGWGELALRAARRGAR